MHKIALITNNQKSSSALKILLWGLVAFFVAACNPANESNTASVPVSATPADANDQPLEPIRYNAMQDGHPMRHPASKKILRVLFRV